MITQIKLQKKEKLITKIKPNNWENVMNSISVLYFIVNYSIIVILGRRMWRYLHRYLMATAEKRIRSVQNVNELDKQITLNLFIKV